MCSAAWGGPNKHAHACPYAHTINIAHYIACRSGICNHTNLCAQAHLNTDGRPIPHPQFTEIKSGGHV